MTLNQKPAIDRTWEESVESLAGLLAGQESLNSALSIGLRFVLERLKLADGLILAPELNKGDPLIFLGSGNTKYWENQIHSQESFLSSLLKKTIDTPGGEIISDTAGKVMILPLVSAEGSQGLMLLNLRDFAKQEKDFLEAASFLIGQRISTHFNQVRMVQYRKGMDLISQIFAGLNTMKAAEELEIRIVRGLQEIFNCQAASIALLNPQPEELLVKKSLVGGSDWIYQVSIKAWGWINGDLYG